MITDANSAKPKRSRSRVKIGDIIITSLGYAKVSGLNPIQAVPITRGRM
ncbi:hypothetical protein [Nitrosopumilus sp.]|nr:hypothetical protein [Nitrosopumilus sp.]